MSKRESETARPSGASSASEVPLGFVQLSQYGMPAIGLAFLLFFVQFYFLKFGVDVLLLPPVLVGAVMTVSKLWDAVSDPMVGNWSDRTRSRLGRRRPWMFAALPVLLLGFLAVWWTPVGKGSFSALVALAGLLVFYSGFTLYAVPHASLGVELSPEPHQRTRAFAVRHLAWTVGLFLAFAAIQWVGNAEDVRERLWTFAGVAGVGALALLVIAPLALREPSARFDRGGADLRHALRDVMASRNARILLIVWFIENMGAGVLGAITPFLAVYVLDRPDLIGMLPGVYAAAGVLSIPIWVVASRRFGKHATWIVAMAISGVGFAATFFVIGSIPLLMVALAAAGAGMGCGGALANAVMADVIDADTARSGERKEGAYTAALNFALKAGISVSTILGGLLLDMAGFVPNEVQSEQTLVAIRLLFAGLPATGFAVGIAFFLRFDLPASRAKTPRVHGAAL